MTTPQDNSSGAFLDGLEDHTDSCFDGHEKQQQEKERKALVKGMENRAVGYLRILVYMVVLVTAVVVCFFVYTLTRNEEEQSFEDNFAAYADKLTDSFNAAIEVRIDAINSLSSAITAFALSSGSKFPNVTVPHFELLAANCRIQAGGVLVGYSPLVTDDTRAGWEAYSVQNPGWFMNAFRADQQYKFAQDAKFGIEGGEAAVEQVLEELKKRQAMANSIRTNRTEEGISTRLFSFGGVVPDGTGPYLPYWQSSPVEPNIRFINFDRLTLFASKDSTQALIKTMKMNLGAATDLEAAEDGQGDTATSFDAALTLGQFRHQNASFGGDPVTPLGYPVYTDFGPNRTLGGVLNMPIYWSLTFEDTLPESAQGIIAVLQNTANQTFTYRVDGSVVTYLGVGDLHDDTFSSMGVQQNVADLIESSAGPSNQGYTTADFDTGFIGYTISIYPSQDTREQYVTKTPLFYTIIVGAIFLFTSLVFIAYDLLVGRRQEKVMKKAVQSGALVASLYPEEMRKQLFDEEKTKKEGDWKVESTPEAALDPNAAPTGSKAVAKLYDESTILFADLAGFTKFSASRKPEDIFLLLETLYQAFDKIALKRKVFKVETIGDCYVAVTGVPDKQEQHAAIMCKFARDCMNKMSNLIQNKLRLELGEEVEELKFRVGIHSGPITGGVLRGMRGRFQLFGDTINTASRMESNGIPGRIHVSESTAEELRKHGFDSWLSERKDKIVAKGKGEMTTFFVNIIAKSMAGKSMISSEDDEEDDDGPSEVKAGPVAEC